MHVTTANHETVAIFSQKVKFGLTNLELIWNPIADRKSYFINMYTAIYNYDPPEYKSLDLIHSKNRKDALLIKP